MKSLRTQLLASHLVLVGLMALVMLGAVVNFLKLGYSIDHILHNNYDSVIAAENMKETLERQDSAATFFLAGQTEKARAQWSTNIPRFEGAYKTEANNITEVGEGDDVKQLGKDFKLYHDAVQALLFTEPSLDDTDARRVYFTSLEPSFIHLKDEAQGILELNQQAIVRANHQAQLEAVRGALIGLGTTLATIVLAFIFARSAINASLTPLIALAQEAEQIGAGHLNRKIELRREDEVGQLARAFNEMTAKLREAYKEQQQRLHRAEKMSDAALESLFDPVLVTDATGTVVHLNRAAQGLFGPAHKAAGVPVGQIIHEPKIVTAIERAIRTESVSAEEGEAGLVSLQSDDCARVYRLRATPMRDDDGLLLGAALVLEDVTHLRELDRLKTEFISVASHELRTPVTSLLLSAQLLDEGAVGELTETQHEVVDAQKEDLGRLDALIRDLLDITKLEAGATPPRFEWISPRELIASAARGVAGQASAKNQRLKTFCRDDLPPVRADRDQIGRVLANLLNNAIRHTPDGGEVRIEAELVTAETARRPGSGGSAAEAVGRDGGPEGGNNGAIAVQGPPVSRGMVFFRVADTGNGIPPEYLPRIFERFAQVPGATRGGAGLGLPISQAILHAHGGTITASSTLGHGSTFEFGLPVLGEE